MTEHFHKPTNFPSGMFEAFMGGEDPAQISRVAHETAHALLSRVREDPDSDVVDKLVSFTDTHGIDAIAELWSRSNAKSLPGALWRIYLLRLLIRQDAEGTSYLFQRGTEVVSTIDPVVAGASAPTGPAEITELADRILRGLFEGDFAVALDRAAAFCRVTAAGCASVADDQDTTQPERASELTTRALRFSRTAEELTSCARLWRHESLD
ncbi:DNA-directed RNA polymerase subunit beta [Leifsonia sp. NPDC058230]|uniref:DNA-directed RNA polymerase subunit beta n=1 Tax=Leifsonia sp. NPDC058230 TaxID=3346391 RepID=UPI0036D8B176